MTHISLETLWDSMMYAINKDRELLINMDRNAGISIWLQLHSDAQARIQGYKTILIDLECGYHMPESDKKYLETKRLQLRQEFSKTLKMNF